MTHSIFTVPVPNVYPDYIVPLKRSMVNIVDATPDLLAWCDALEYVALGLLITAPH
ncbi:hypothetical protein GCM10010987_76690 [Bradyrhizobium guangdongense]|uniref:Uncharacterized protein n=1 Tax=Bradyrhizobium guangdongense TaxID=1325090 RepID=A0AA87WC19_9BRAD|nr:hypothetical protein GCM10010987_76690 [Bradyrhizobium guangdongense]